jgi:DNA-binding SARP family transcriptional activator/pimeloyl-ACP methyl ester carboxylesterase
MRVGVLGDLEILDDSGNRILLRAQKERELLAVLIAQAQRPVSADTLIEALWGAEPPRTANKTLQTYVSHLRHYLPGRIQTRPSGYVLEEYELDTADFEAILNRGRLALLRQEYSDAASLLAEAIALWRGPPYNGLDGSEVVLAESARLNELRLAAIEDWIEARLASGPSKDLSVELESLVRENPLRERLWELLMISLYRSGRQVEALRAFQRARQVLVEEVGVEPGAGLRWVEAAILAHDPKLGIQEDIGPTTSYVTSEDGLRIAYWTHGKGTRDLLFFAEVTFNLELLWETEELNTVLESLVQGRRLIAIQRRGTGISDRSPDGQLAPPEGCIGDTDRVLDVVGADEVDVLGWGHGGQLGLAYAARRPQRVRRLAVVNSYARFTSTTGYRIGQAQDLLEPFYRWVQHHWGTDILTSGYGIHSSRLLNDQAFARRLARYHRLTATSKEIAEIIRQVHRFDVRWALPMVHCPLLVVRLSESPEDARLSAYIAKQVASSEYVELPGRFVPTPEEGVEVGRVLDRFFSD